MKRSKWFPASQDPGLPGLYEFRLAGDKTISKRLWDGHFWFFLNGVRDWVESVDHWRGLAENPNE